MMGTSPLTFAKDWARSVFGSNPNAMRLLYGIRHKELIVTENKDVVIEGFPRCANTYIFFLVLNASSRSLNIAHHMHLSSQIKLALKYNVPAIVLIRNPLDAVVSYVLREKGSPTLAFNWYYDFYSDLLDVRRDVYVAKFEDITSNSKSFLKEISAKYPSLAINRFEFDREEIYNEIDLLDTELKKGADFSKINTRPNAQKNIHKMELKAKFQQDQKLTKLLDSCNNLYTEFIS